MVNIVARMDYVILKETAQLDIFVHPVKLIKNRLTKNVNLVIIVQKELSNIMYARLDSINLQKVKIIV